MRTHNYQSAELAEAELQHYDPLGVTHLGCHVSRLAVCSEKYTLPQETLSDPMMPGARRQELPQPLLLGKTAKVAHKEIEYNTRNRG